MSDPGNGTGMALAYVREELAGLRTNMNDALGGVRSDLAALAGELRGYINEHGPAFAVIQHRLAEVEKDLSALTVKCDTAEREREATELTTKRDRVAYRVSIAIALISVLLAWVLPLMAK